MLQYNKSKTATIDLKCKSKEDRKARAYLQGSKHDEYEEFDIPNHDKTEEDVDDPEEADWIPGDPGRAGHGPGNIWVRENKIPKNKARKASHTQRLCTVFGTGHTVHGHLLTRT